MSAARSIHRGRVILHAGSLFVLSVIMSGNGTVLPQLFYQRFHADRKVLLLSVCLLAGTASATIGVLASRGGAVSRRLALTVLAGTLAVESALFLVRGAPLYAALNAAAQLGANLLVNHLDHAASARAGDAGRRLHDVAGNTLRLAGMLLAPAFFTACYDVPAALVAALVVGATLALISAATLLDHAPDRAARDGAEPSARPLDTHDRLLFGFVIAVYVSLYLLAANLIYLLRDVIHLEGAERRGGLVIAAVFTAALFTVPLASIAQRRRDDDGPHAAALAAPLPMLALSSAAVAGGARLGFAGILAGGVILGVSYGIFLAEVREYTSRGARAEGKTGLYTLFNNTANLSALLAAALMLLIASIMRGAGVYLALLATVSALPICALPLLFVALSRRPLPSQR